LLLLLPSLLVLLAFLVTPPHLHPLHQPALPPQELRLLLLLLLLLPPRAAALPLLSSLQHSNCQRLPL
jgi:hypothetical protein